MCFLKIATWYLNVEACRSIDGLSSELISPLNGLLAASRCLVKMPPPPLSLFSQWPFAMSPVVYVRKEAGGQHQSIKHTTERKKNVARSWCTMLMLQRQWNAFCEFP